MAKEAIAIKPQPTKNNWKWQKKPSRRNLNIKELKLTERNVSRRNGTHHDGTEPIATEGSEIIIKNRNATKTYLIKKD
jgi:hypothetical protein